MASVVRVLGEPVREVVSGCPLLGQQQQIMFIAQFADEPDLRVLTRINGCRFVSNGTLRGSYRSTSTDLDIIRASNLM
ncbi:MULTISPECIES: hypothetical protein [Actinomadura]|uniref:Uncharacterized protein n=1 Tax=Actinomadura yumaensis TaxID=111807 RepID=A0ABW2CUE6_9ACTN|nr:hypothetical protein [Actinomadura sp. J1-007]MWK33258.1 hypothetical protein [Actinomadura sp. J1-007]